MFRLFVVFIFLQSVLFSYEPAVSIFPTKTAAAKEAARKIADLISARKGNKTVLGLATGSTMIPLYQELKTILVKEAIDLSQVITFNLDEYVDLPLSHPQSYRSFMFSHLFDALIASNENPLGIKEENIHFPSKDNCAAYEKQLRDLGPIDLQLLGIGRNGHIGFAEPGTPFDSETMLVDLAFSTRSDNASFFDNDITQVPKQAVTMGIRSILQAKEILLLAFGEAKAEAIAKTIMAPISPSIPASALRNHPRVSIALDEPAAQLLPSSKIIRFVHARLLKEHTIQEGELWVSKGKIIPPQPKADLVIDVGGNILAPGYIDLQINGGFGIDFSTDPENLAFVARELPRFGVTSFLPTVISSTKEQYQKILPRLLPRSFGSKGAAAIGIHLEGPFFADNYKGAHHAKFILSKAAPVEEIYGDVSGVKLITLAPELEGMESLIKTLKNKGIVIAAGHSAATLSQMRTAIASGIRFATHLFNAMSPYHHREAGIVGAALVDAAIPYSVILDGVHLAPEAVRLAWKCNPKGLILITDATAALGLPNGRRKLGAMEIEVKEDRVVIEGTNTIAGSKTSLDQAVRNLHKIAGCTQAEALEAASAKPAEILQIYPQKGSLSMGADADFLVLSDRLEVQQTYIGGELAWSIKSEH